MVEKPAEARAPVWREDSDGQRLMAVISMDGLAAIGMLPADTSKHGSRSNTGKSAAAPHTSPTAAVSHNEARMPRAGTKLAALVGLLERNGGATVEEMMEATGWQAHSVRGVMSGALVKKFGLTVVSEKCEHGRAYRLRS